MIEIGTELPPLERRITLADMVAYAGATWDWHRLHYDPDYLQSKQLPAPVVDGQVLGALLAEQAQDWAGPDWWLRELSFTFRAFVFAGDTVRCTATVIAADDNRVEIAQRVDVIEDGLIVRAAASPAAAVLGSWSGGAT